MGDLAFSAPSEIVCAHMRATDCVVRYGAEEVCLVMPGATLEEDVSVIERLHEAVAKHPLRTIATEPLDYAYLNRRLPTYHGCAPTCATLWFCRLKDLLEQFRSAGGGIGADILFLCGDLEEQAIQ